MKYVQPDNRDLAVKLDQELVFRIWNCAFFPISALEMNSQVGAEREQWDEGEASLSLAGVSKGRGEGDE